MIKRQITCDNSDIFKSDLTESLYTNTLKCCIFIYLFYLALCDKLMLCYVFLAEITGLFTICCQVVGPRHATRAVVFVRVALLIFSVESASRFVK